MKRGSTAVAVVLWLLFLGNTVLSLMNGLGALQEEDPSSPIPRFQPPPPKPPF